MLKLFLRLLPFFLLIIFSCTTPSVNKKQPPVSDLPKNKDSLDLHIDLPWESWSDWEEVRETDPWFQLRDSTGKKILLSYDTLTKGGGHLDYNGIHAGRYEYTIKTVFKETLIGRLDISGDSSMGIFPEYIYPTRDTLLLDSIVQADSVKIAFSQNYASNYHLFTIYKEGNAYKVNYFSGDVNEPVFRRQTTIDSVTVIHAIVNLEAILIGLQTMGTTEFELGPDPILVYIKVNNTLFNSYSYIETFFLEALDRFRTSLLSKKGK